MEALQDAVELIARSLRVEHVTVLELAPQSEDVRLRAGVGWEEGVIGHTVDAMPGGYVRFTLDATEPVIVEDLATEERFTPSPVLLGAGIRASAAVRIPGRGERPYGVIGAHSTARRTFGSDEIAFLADMAGILSSVIARHRQAVEINDEILQAMIVAHYAAQQGRPEAAELLERAIARTRSLVSEMLDEGGAVSLPGDLRRGGAARVTPPAP
jgi:GAF domain-containing protein